MVHIDISGYTYFRSVRTSYGLTHVDGWRGRMPYIFHDVARVSWVGAVLYRSCTAFHRQVKNIDDLVHNLSDLWRKPFTHLV